jgi:hypothetical protein
MFAANPPTGFANSVPNNSSARSHFINTSEWYHSGCVGGHLAGGRTGIIFD